MRKNCLNGFVVCIATAVGLLSVPTPSFGESVPATNSMDVSCGPAPPGHPVKGRRDYRLMASNEKDARDLRYHEYFHIQPAEKQIRSGNLNWNVMNNLHFVLHKVPNDHRALALLVQWAKAGGHDKNYASPGCYLTWARQFTPDDTTVLSYGGYYFYEKKDFNRARQWWEQALAVDAANADVHYNLGLLMFDQGKYAEARTHALAAYAAGYPLPGLREKLQQVGQWQQPLTSKE
jgi:tetratricopeptide (TPR) repeat protein